MWFIYWDACGLACYAFVSASVLRCWYQYDLPGFALVDGREGWFTILFVNYVTQTEMLYPALGTSPLGVGAMATYQAVLLTIMCVYTRAATTDPGSVPRDTATRDDIWPPKDDPDRMWKPKRRFCEKCSALKPPRAHHCSVCGRCIQRMDHHCPWVNNCVGANNMKFFLQFLFFIALGSTLTLLTAAVKLWSCFASRPVLVLPPSQCAPDTTSLVLQAVAGVLAVFFLVFVCAMACDQYEGLTTNTTAIEAMKGWEEESVGVGEGLTLACGRPFGIHWFLPTSVPSDAPIYYAYSPDADPDEYDPRDPIIKKHFARINAQLHKEQRAADAGAEQDGAAEHESNAPAPIDTSDPSSRVSAPTHRVGGPRVVSTSAATAAVRDAGVPAFAKVNSAESEDTPVPSSISCARPVHAGHTNDGSLPHTHTHTHMHTHTDSRGADLTTQDGGEDASAIGTQQSTNGEGERNPPAAAVSAGVRRRPRQRE